LSWSIGLVIGFVVIEKLYGRQGDLAAPFSPADIGAGGDGAGKLTVPDQIRRQDCGDLPVLLHDSTLDANQSSTTIPRPPQSCRHFLGGGEVGDGELLPRRS
jgi:hypothetical protein